MLRPRVAPAQARPGWLERPLACVVLKDGYAEDEEMKGQLLTYLESQFAKWWVPDDIVFLKEVPKTSVVKFLKAALRRELSEQYSGK